MLRSWTRPVSNSSWWRLCAAWPRGRTGAATDCDRSRDLEVVSSDTEDPSTTVIYRRVAIIELVGYLAGEFTKVEWVGHATESPGHSMRSCSARSVAVGRVRDSVDSTSAKRRAAPANEGSSRTRRTAAAIWSLPAAFCTRTPAPS